MAEFVPQPELEGLTELEDGSVLVDGIEDEDSEQEVEFYDNLSPSLSSFVLNSVATALLDLIEKDQEARKERDKQQEEGIRRTGLGDDAPGGASFDGASRIVHPVLAEGCVDFAARAIKELFPSNGPVKTKIDGEVNSGSLDKARRKRDFLNFYLTERMQEYRSEKETLLTQLPLGGSQYEKYWFDGKRVRMEFVPIDKVLLPYSANSFYTTPRLTHIREVTEEKIKAAVEEGFYEDVFGMADSSVEETASQEATDKIEGKSPSGYNEDGIRIIYEVSCNWDVEGDGTAPYVIHIDEPSGRVCAIYRNWKESDEDKERLDWWVEDKFIPWRGAYGIGLPHLIGGMSGALTGALRALLDSAHINNAPSALKLKGGRASGQNLSVDLTSVTEVEAPAGVDDIRKVMMPLPFNPPSAVLFQLLDWITGQAKGVVATAEERIADAGNNMPVGTALALIEQGSQVFSSIHARLHDAQRRALQIICRLIATYPEHALADMGRFNLVPEDFLESSDIAPVSDPNIFSESQRFAQMQSVMQLAGADVQDPSIPWNKLAIRRRMLELLRIDGIDEFLPKPPEPVTADPVTENVAIMNGAMIKANIVQDHMAHIKAHLAFIMQPMVAESDLVNPQALMGLLAHIQEHLLFSYQVESQIAAQMIRLRYPDLSPDNLAAQASMVAVGSVSQTDAQLMPMIKQANEIVKSKMPPPPVDPAVQATKEVAMAQIEQRREESNADNQLAVAKQQFEQSLRQQEFNNEQQRLAYEPLINAATERFNAQLEVERMQREDEREELRQQVELLKNDADNRSHQITELLKNRDDNETKIQIAELSRRMDEIPTAMSSGIEPMVQQMQEMLSQIEKAKTGDALQATLEGLRAVVANINAPTEVIRGPDGKAIGTRKVIS